MKECEHPAQYLRFSDVRYDREEDPQKLRDLGLSEEIKEWEMTNDKSN
jgi:hypothetical protein